MRKTLILTMVFLLALTPVLALKETTIYLPAVKESDFGLQGAMATVTVDVREGKGHVYVDTWPLTKIDTQASARIAKQVACDILSADCSNYDFYYTIRSEAQIVGGPSGGAAMTIATLASLLDKTINNNILITGTINLDGSIGPVSGILEKAEAVSDMGHTFLIPKGQSIVEVQETTTEEIGPMVIEESSPKKINVKTYAKENLNLTIIEVGTVEEAFTYFTNYKIITPELTFQRTEEYQEVMKKMADELIGYSEEAKERCNKELEDSDLDYNYQNQISEICELSLNNAYETYKRGSYYSASSNAFSRSSSFIFGEALVRLFSSENQKSFVKDYLKESEEGIFEVNISNIELYAITEERISEAQNKVENAWRNYYNEDYVQAVYDASFARARMYTATLWSKYSGEFPEYINQTEDLKEVSTEILSEVSSILTYSSFSSSNSFLESAEELLEDARESHEAENYYTAIILGLKSGANAELASETEYSDYSYLIELHKKRALISINKTNSVIGQSYFEYAQSLEKDNPSASLMYYTYSEKLSKLSILLNKATFPETIEPCEYLETVPFNCDNYVPFVLLLLVIAFFAGILLGRI